ncbi:MAG: Plug and carboxypeptidase regulatory-like domain-containing protein [Gemmatimonadota bacterium]|nr:Plug and carboxypeptidase regulatory-like domain-containing protein [Gemmatimonadota bacterium]
MVHVGAGDARSPATAVVLADTTGRIVAGTMTGLDGSFAITAPSAGIYRVRIRRIGFSPDSSALLHLGAGERQTFDSRLDVLTTLQLPAVAVTETRRCVISPEAGTAAFRLWQEAQTALTGTVAGASHGKLQFLLGRFEREVDISTGDVVRSRDWVVAENGESFQSVSAESLAVHGFAHAEGDHSVYYAPDGRTLTSEAFARTHCLTPVLDPRHPELVGLGFKPVNGQRERTTDVSGVLWLDRNTAQLRFLEYAYTGEGSGASAGAKDTELASGRVDYQLLASGAWIVNNWLIRAPIVTNARKSEVQKSDDYFIVRTRTTGHVTSRWEIGGTVRAIRDPSALGTTTAVLATVHGQVVTGASEAERNAGAVSEVIVALIGNADTGSNGAAETDSASKSARRSSVDASGRFSFDSVAAGNYLLRTTSPRLDTLYVRVPDTRIALGAGETISARITLPSQTDALANLCRQSPASDNRIVHGTVRDSVNGAPVRAASVRASWLHDGMISGGGKGISMTTTERDTQTDSAGHYILCALPSSRTVTIRTSIKSLRALPVRIDGGAEPGAGTVLMRDIVMETSNAQLYVTDANGTLTRGSTSRASKSVAPTGLGTIEGTVVDSAGHGLADVGVSLLEPNGTVSRTSSNGGFRLDGVAAGTHVVRFRRVGLQPVTLRVDVKSGDVVQTDAVLSVASKTLATVVVRGAGIDTLYLPAGVGDRIANGMGTYLTSRDIQRRKVSRTTDLLRGIAGLELSKTGAVGNSRGLISIYTPGCTAGAPIYLDGILLDNTNSGTDTNVSGTSAIDMIPPADVAAIEVYRGAAELPAGLPRNVCGGVFIWTRNR